MSEEDPAAFKSMVLKVDKLTNAVGRAHPLLFGDVSGSTAVIPISVQNDLALGGDHPMTSTRIKRANEEISDGRWPLPHQEASQQAEYSPPLQ